MRLWLNLPGVILLLPLIMAAADPDRTALETRAAAGDAEAQYQLAEALYWGRGGPQDLKQAVDWARLSAKAGHAKGRLRLATQMLFGQGVTGNPENDRLGLEHLNASVPGLEKLAGQGDADAQAKLAELYFWGLVKGADEQPYAPDRKKAAALFEKAAKGGHVDAHYRLSLVYKSDTTDQRNFEKIIGWLRMAAEKGSVNAAYDLWIANRQSRGQLVNLQEARPLLTAAAKAGLADAQYHFGAALITAVFGPADKKGGIEWIKKAAEQGQPNAQVHLAAVLSNPAFQALDLPRAYFWLNRAMNSSNERVQRDAQLGMASLRQKLSADKIFEIQLEARNFKPKKTLVTRNFKLGLAGAEQRTILQIRVQLLTGQAEKGNVTAMVILGNEYRALPTMDESIRWYKKAAEKKHPRACRVLGATYLDGVPGKLEPDLAKGFVWLRQAADLGDVVSMNRLGVEIIEGNLKGAKPPEGLQWIRRAAELGHPYAQDNLGRFYQEGDLVEQDYAKAVVLFKKSAAQHYPMAQFRLGRLYLIGPGKIKPDINEAIKWFRLAARQGFPEAQFVLGGIHMDGTGGIKKDPETGYRWLEIARRSGMRGVEATFKRYENALTQEQKQRAIAMAAQFRPQNFFRLGGSANNPPAASALAKLPLKELTARANAGEADAQFHLAERYASGQGVKLDAVQAFMWYHLAAEQGHKSAPAARGQLAKVQGMTVDQIIAARNRAAQFKPKKK